MGRYFLGIDLPGELKTRLRVAQACLIDSGIDARGWSNPNLCHITTLFLGELDPTHLRTVETIAKEVASSVRPFSLFTGGYGVFPQNKVLWLGFDGQRGNIGRLKQLADALRDEVNLALPIALDPRHFRPHITLARKVRDASRLRKAPPFTTYEVQVQDLCLFESLRIDGELQYPVQKRFEFSLSND